MNHSTAHTTFARTALDASASPHARAQAGWWARLKGRPPALNLALQGGGAHGAFTWGVLDALLAQPQIDFEGLSGSSAGAMNAVVLADGWMKGGRRGLEGARKGARQALSDFWTAVGQQMPPGLVSQGHSDAIEPTPAAKMLAGWAGCLASRRCRRRVPLRPASSRPIRRLTAARRLRRPAGRRLRRQGARSIRRCQGCRVRPCRRR